VGKWRAGVQKLTTAAHFTAPYMYVAIDTDKLGALNRHTLWVRAKL